jgi:LemA protein
MKRTGLVIIAGLVLLGLIVVMMAVGGYNRMVRLKQATDRQWAQVQNVYQRRADLIPNLVSTVSGAANFEKSTLTDITQARASVGQVKIDPNSSPANPALSAGYPFGLSNETRLAPVTP